MAGLGAGFAEAVATYQPWLTGPPDFRPGAAISCGGFRLAGPFGIELHSAMDKCGTRTGLQLGELRLSGLGLRAPGGVAKHFDEFGALVLPPPQLAESGAVALLRQQCPAEGLHSARLRGALSGGLHIKAAQALAEVLRQLAL